MDFLPLTILFARDRLSYISDEFSIFRRSFHEEVCVLRYVLYLLVVLFFGLR